MRRVLLCVVVRCCCKLCVGCWGCGVLLVVDGCWLLVLFAGVAWCLLFVDCCVAVACCSLVVMCWLLVRV